MNILMTGGGTGGHVIPNIALIPYLLEGGANILYMGSQDSIEERLIGEIGAPFYAVPTIKLRRDNILKNIAIPHVLRRGIREAKRIMRPLDIDVVFAKGGYVSLPPCYAARALKIPVICHESDSSLGLANRLISRHARLTMTAYPNTPCKGVHVTTGNPVRESIMHGNKSKILPHIHHDAGYPYLLIMGGSQGARSINAFIREHLDTLTARYNVIHLAGKGLAHIEHIRYTEIEYASDIEDYLDLADVVISRAGAGAISEVDALGKSTVLIPLENRSSRGDQLANAHIMERLSKAIVVRECGLTIDRLMTALDDSRRIELVPRDPSIINRRIAKYILDIASSHVSNH